ncbi:MAG: phage major capsid protein [Syntrophales bacterium]|nr:phage major capsid protein [Syntrophales bacterium]MDD5640575.1 phage major capsid protein [Syntrophales bacterium]
MHTELKRLLTEIKDAMPENLNRRLEDVESKLRTRKWASLPGVEAEKFSFFKAIRGIQTGDWSNAGYEKEVFDSTRRKALGTADDVAGGYLVPAQAMGDLIEMLRADSVVIQSGARVIDNLYGSPVLFPKQTGGATVYWIGDNDTITPSQPTFGQLRLEPHKAAALCQLSNSLLAMSNPSAEAVVRQDIATGMALAVDLVALRGTGTENEPLGIANTPGINTALAGDGVNGAPLGNSLDLFEDLSYQLAADNALKGSLGFVFHPVVRRVLRKMKVPQWSGDTGGYPLIPAVIMAAMSGDNALREAIGYQFRTTTQLPVNLTKGNKSNCTEVFFGNWSELIIGQWAGMSILASNQAGTAFQTDQTWIRVILNCDIAVRHEKSFALCNDLAIS